ncbi:MAG TPA: ATP-binding cassette domain-containing protein [Deltaproteobacteria bacterium]|nr:ATP-binding cassette domain-containing protein [Deltaproteobacteria bacterium]HPR54459.1 ATP-binding cassette domain-containing protein [Deltaproteobacteria bacterium]HXK46212.1 ATP-binding cassette domain-containing protein [Deltaproteobacteria bacterium]
MVLQADITRRLSHFTLDVSLLCEAGKVLSIVGPSGAGKTTILRIIAGLEVPDAGRITVDGETWMDTAGKVMVPTRRRALGMVFQEFPLFPHLNVWKNVCFSAPDTALARAYMERFGIWHLKDSRPDAVSGGERQRCAICQALARKPKVLLMDEPFSALDPLTRRRLRDAVRDIKTELNIPILHVTHDIREALFLGDEILPVVNGRVFHKWLLQFMISAREGFRCPDSGEIYEDIELPMRMKECSR